MLCRSLTGTNGLLTMFPLNIIALWNVAQRDVNDVRLQSAKSWLKEEAFLKAKLKDVTKPVSHPEISWSKVVAVLNTEFMSSTLVTSKPDYLKRKTVGGRVGELNLLCDCP